MIRQITHLFWLFAAPMRAMRTLRTARQIGVLHPVIIEQLLIPIPIPFGLMLFLFGHSEGTIAARGATILRRSGVDELLLYGATFLVVSGVSAIIPRVLARMIQAENAGGQDGTVAEQIYVMFLSFVPLYFYPLFHAGSATLTVACYALCLLWMTLAGIVVNRAYYAPAPSPAVARVQGGAMLILAGVAVLLALFTIRIENAVIGATPSWR